MFALFSRFSLFSSFKFSVTMHPQRVKICIIAWIILKSQMFVAPVNQKSDGSIFFLYSSSLVSAQRISPDERSVTRTDPGHFQGMDFRRSRYNENVAQFDIFLLLSSPMSESISCRDHWWKTWHFLKAPKRGFLFSFSRWMLMKSQWKFTFSVSGLLVCQ